MPQTFVIQRPLDVDFKNGITNNNGSIPVLKVELSINQREITLGYAEHNALQILILEPPEIAQRYQEPQPAYLYIPVPGPSRSLTREEYIELARPLLTKTKRECVLELLQIYRSIPATDSRK